MSECVCVCVLVVRVCVCYSLSLSLSLSLNHSQKINKPHKNLLTTYTDRQSFPHALWQLTNEHSVVVCNCKRPTGEVDARIVAYLRSEGRDEIDTHYSDVGSTNSGTTNNHHILTGIRIDPRATTARHINDCRNNWKRVSELGARHNQGGVVPKQKWKI